MSTQTRATLEDLYKVQGKAEGVAAGGGCVVGLNLVTVAPAQRLSFRRK